MSDEGGEDERGCTLARFAACARRAKGPYATKDVRTKPDRICVHDLHPIPYVYAGAVPSLVHERRTTEGMHTMSKARPPRGYPIDTIREIESKNSGAGQFFFSSGAMSFFNSRVADDVINHRFFFTTEKGPSGERRTTIRMITDAGHIEDVGAFQQFDAPAKARKALRAALAEGVEVRNDPYDGDSDPTNPRRFGWRAYIGELPIGPRTTKWHAQRVGAQAKRPAYTA